MGSRLKDRLAATGVAGVTWAAPIGFAVGIDHVLHLGCPMRAATGLDCPACGATRAVLNLGQGRLLDALHYNALLICLGLPLVAAITLSKLNGEGSRYLPNWVQQHLGRYVWTTVVVWTVLRNLPTFHALNTGWRAS